MSGRGDDETAGRAPRAALAGVPAPVPALFLERRSYRRRRVRDAARVLPLIALFFWLAPMLWSDAARPDAATALIFLFAVWAGLILGAALLARAMGPLDMADPGAAGAPAAVSRRDEGAP